MTQLSGMARSVSPVVRAPHSIVTRLSGMARSVSPMARAMVSMGRVRPAAAIGAMQAGVSVGRMRPAAALSASMRPSAAIGTLRSECQEVPCALQLQWEQPCQVFPWAACALLQQLTYAAWCFSGSHASAASYDTAFRNSSISITCGRALHSMVTRLSDMARSVSPMARA